MVYLAISSSPQPSPLPSVCATIWSISDSRKGTSGLLSIDVIIPPTIIDLSNRLPSFNKIKAT